MIEVRGEFSQTYGYRCVSCGARRELRRHVDDRDAPVGCVECDSYLPMKRLYFPPKFTANRECDKIENRVYHGDREDVRRQQKADDERYERMTANWDLSKPKETSMDDILRSGVIEASKTPEGLERWRKEHIPADSMPVNA